MEVITSLQNVHVKTWKKLQTRKGRQKSGQYLVEGFHLVEEALAQDGLVKEVIYTKDTILPFSLTETAFDVYEVTREVSHAISDTKTDQGVFAVVEMLEPSILMLFGKRFLLVDAVQDPGNVGTLIRTADAAGYDAVVLGRGSADLYNPKVIRSAQGSHFHIPVIQANLLEWIGGLEEEGVPVIGALLDEHATKLEDIDPKETLALVVGNEGAGISAPIVERLSERVYIPIYGKSESLNVAVAAGILMYGIRK